MDRHHTGTDAGRWVTMQGKLQQSSCRGAPGMSRHEPGAPTCGRRRRPLCPTAPPLLLLLLRQVLLLHLLILLQQVLRCGGVAQKELAHCQRQRGVAVAARALQRARVVGQ